MASGTIKTDNWTLAGTSARDTQNVTYPSTAKELFIIFTGTTGGLLWSYQTTVVVDAIQSVKVIVVGSHYYSTSGNAFGYAFANHDSSNRTIALRRYTLAEATDGKITVYYR